MNTLLLFPELFRGEGGIARILRLYLKASCEISSAGDNVRFLSLNDSVVDSGDLRRYSDEKLSGWAVFNRRKIPFSRESIRLGVRSDRIICGHVAQLPLAWAASILKPSIKFYLVAHGIEVWRPFTFFERLALKRAWRILCVSEYTRQQVLKFSVLSGERTTVVSNALDPFMDSPDAIAATGGPPVILSVSRLTVADSYKGIEHLISAMPAVVAQIPEARLRVVGRGDGLSALQRMVGNMSLNGSVEFAGYRNDSELREELDCCRLFALPSQKEGFGLVFLEAMAHGRPCIGTRSGGVPEVITPETGILVEYGNIPAISSAIVEALRRDWPTGPLLDRAKRFSYPVFRKRLAAALTE